MSESLRLMQFNPAWKQEFEQTRSSVLQACEGWVTDCLHIGATALVDTIAGPVVDLAAGLRDLSKMNEVAALIEGLNFRRVETPTWCDNELVACFEKPRTGLATHRVFLVSIEGPAWVRMLQHREQLLHSEPLRSALAELKQSHYRGGCTAAADYADAKRQFFDQLDQR